MTNLVLANIALSKIGDQQITSFSDGTPQSNLCSLLYQPTLSELLRMHTWEWATGMATLTQNTAQPAFDWNYSYVLPSDFDRIITFNAFPASQPNAPFEIQDNGSGTASYLFTDEGTAQITYIKNLQVGEESLFDPMFVELFAIRLASKLAKPLGGSMDIKNRLDSEFRIFFGECVRIDAADSYPRRKQLYTNSDFVNARYTYIG